MSLINFVVCWLIETKIELSYTFWIKNDQTKLIVKGECGACGVLQNKTYLYIVLMLI